MKNTFEMLNDNYQHKAELYHKSERTEILELIPKGAKNFLDIGCSDGTFGKNIKDMVPESEVWGIEPHQESANIAGQKLDFVITDVFKNDLAEIQNRKFDVVSFNDVLEHLITPQETLNELKQFLSKDGVVLASIPNILFYPVFFKEIILKQDWQYTDNGTLDYTHLRFFTKKSIVRMFNQAGYKVEVIEGIHPMKSRMYSLINFFTFGKINDWKYLQFRIRAKIN